MADAKARFGGEAILPFCYGGSNGLLTQDTIDALLFRRFGASRLARTVCAAPTGAANQGALRQDAVGRLPGLLHARLIVLWGVNPSASGIHLVPYIREAQRSGATLVVIDPRTTPLARHADLHLAVRPGTDLAGRAGPPPLPVRERAAPTRRSSPRTRRAPTRLRERARGVDDRRARRIVPASPDDGLQRFAELYADASPALIRCGWGLERNRNGGSAVAAVLALPAVGGKFGVRGGGYTMSNSAAWSIDSDLDRRRRTGDAPGQHEPPRARAHRADRPAGEGAVRLQLQPAGDGAGSEPRAPRAGARGPLHRRLRPGDDRHGALRRRRPAGHHVPRALRLRPGVRPDQPAADAAGHRAGRRGAAERRRLRRARSAPRPVSETTSRRRDRDAAARDGRAAPRRGPGHRVRHAGRAAIRTDAGPVRRRLSADAGPEGAPVSGRARARGARRPLSRTSRIPAPRRTRSR